MIRDIELVLSKTQLTVFIRYNSPKNVNSVIMSFHKKYLHLCLEIENLIQLHEKVWEPLAESVKM